MASKKYYSKSLRKKLYIRQELRSVSRPMKFLSNNFESNCVTTTATVVVRQQTTTYCIGSVGLKRAPNHKWGLNSLPILTSCSTLLQSVLSLLPTAFCFFNFKEHPPILFCFCLKLLSSQQIYNVLSEQNHFFRGFSLNKIIKFRS